MINNKNQLKKALKENKNNIKIKRVYNLEKNNKINVRCSSRSSRKHNKCSC